MTNHASLSAFRNGLTLSMADAPMLNHTFYYTYYTYTTKVFKVYYTYDICGKSVKTT